MFAREKKHIYIKIFCARIFLFPLNTPLCLYTVQYHDRRFFSPTNPLRILAIFKELSPCWNSKLIERNNLKNGIKLI